MNKNIQSNLCTEILQPLGDSIVLTVESVKADNSTISNWKSINSAPKNKVILTNRGTARYIDQQEWASPVTNGWYNCDSEGEVFTCADDGMSISRIEPKYWMHIPLLDI